jgi:hypothetical protein
LKLLQQTGNRACGSCFYQKPAVARKDASAPTAAIHHDKNIFFFANIVFA